MVNLNLYFIYVFCLKKYNDPLYEIIWNGSFEIISTISKENQYIYSLSSFSSMPFSQPDIFSMQIKHESKSKR